MSVKNIAFGEATKVSTGEGGGVKIDGFFGLALSNQAQPNMSVVFQQMIDQGVVDKPVFGFYLNR